MIGIIAFVQSLTSVKKKPISGEFDSENMMYEAERPSYIPLATKRNGNEIENTSKDPRTIRALELKYTPSIFE